MPESEYYNKEQYKYYQKVNFKEFYEISKWIFKIVFSVNPFVATVSLVFSLIDNFQQLINSFILAKIIDTMVNIASSPEAAISDIYPALGLLIGINLIIISLNFVQIYSERVLRRTAQIKLNVLLYTKIHSLGIQSLENPEVNNKINRSSSFMYNCIRYFNQLSNIFNSIGGIVATAAIVFSFAPVVIPIYLILSIPKFFIDRKYRGLAWKLDLDTTEEDRKSSFTMFNLRDTKPLQDIFINNAFNFFDKKFQDFQIWYSKKALVIDKKWNFFNGLTDLVSNLGLFIGLVYIFAGFIKRTVSVGTVYFQINTLQNLSTNITRLMVNLNNLSDFAIRMKDVHQLFQLEPEFKEGKIKMKELEKGPDIEFKDINFKYPRTNKYVIKNFNLKIKSGEKIALVGPNGAGKTTLVKLISRMYQTPEGDVLINGTDIDDINSYSLHKNLAVLFQDFSTYSQFTVKENIYVGRSQKPLDENKIIKAAKSAEAFEFIQEMPDKFDQVLSEKFSGGIKPSTGQWQKIVIARFFYRNAPLVIFDEPTASIDAESEYNIFNRIYKYFEGKTVIIISHRYSTVRNADRIIVLDNGSIVEEGSHDELMKKNGKYAKSFLLQAAGYKTEPITSIS